MPQGIKFTSEETETIKEKIVEFLEGNEFATLANAFGAAGIGHSHFDKMMKADPVWAERVRSIRLTGIETTKDAILSRMVKDALEGNTKAQAWWLERVGGLHRKTVHVGDKASDPIQLEVQNDAIDRILNTFQRLVGGPAPSSDTGEAAGGDGDA